jgi:hypothetical protein
VGVEKPCGGISRSFSYNKVEADKMNNDDCIYTYTPDMTRPFCPECGGFVEQETNTPHTPWKGICSSGHAFIFQLEEKNEAEVG